MPGVADSRLLRVVLLGEKEVTEPESLVSCILYGAYASRPSPANSNPTEGHTGSPGIVRESGSPESLTEGTEDTEVFLRVLYGFGESQLRWNQNDAREIGIREVGKDSDIYLRHIFLQTC